MNDWNAILYAFMSGAASLMMGLGLGLAAIMPSVDRWSKRFFIIFFGVLFLNACLALAETIFSEMLHAAGAVRAVDFLMSLLSAIPLPMQAVFLKHCCGEDWRSSPRLRGVIVLWGVYLLLLVIAQFTSLFYYVTPDSRFHFGPGYALMVVPLVTIELINLADLIRRRGRLTGKLFFAMLISVLPLTVALIVHLFVPVFPYLHIGIAILALSMYGIILSDQIEQFLRQQRKIASQLDSILALQMRPHFIHNTLMSIYYLCQQNPVEAQRVTLNFNTYLEKNLNALSSDETIPFSEELEHTRAYLNVEQALYGKSLFVDYDMPHTHFRVPPLTLQPIVENAIKHGLDPDSDPIHIFIQTRQTDSGSEIIVSDNGPGFESTDNDRPHIALANIRQRLELMCSGKMTILPREGGGTLVKLTIPFEKGQ
ncbi:MAG: histidine kinase [Clostridia bacterium]|nr:histidine kinase [Clostridia bacterium]